MHAHSSLWALVGLVLLPEIAHGAANGSKPSKQMERLLPLLDPAVYDVSTRPSAANPDGTCLTEPRPDIIDIELYVENIWGLDQKKQKCACSGARQS